MLCIPSIRRVIIWTTTIIYHVSYGSATRSGRATQRFIKQSLRGLFCFKRNSLLTKADKYAKIIKPKDQQTVSFAKVFILKLYPWVELLFCTLCVILQNADLKTVEVYKFVIFLLKIANICVTLVIVQIQKAGHKKDTLQKIAICRGV